MDENRAKDQAEKLRTKTEVPGDFDLEWIKLRYIELGQEVPDTQNPDKRIILVEDRLVWIARFSKAISWWELAIDDKSGTLVRVQRSR